ncbi:MAG: DNA polymerase III subunit alpha [Candidatus Ancillula sp.]|jgi:DNA polymerase-3 subunit alpha|nr:DNA polymerase III subunit alpha [Candidatus Ancillula sp.]
MLKPNEFCHLHNHSDYSMLDGAAKIAKMVRRVSDLGQTAVALTDHGVLHGIYYLWDECRKHNISVEKTGEGVKVKPILGVEAYVTPGTNRSDNSRVFFGGPYGDSPEEKQRRRDDVSSGGTYTHMTIWAENNEGLHNLNWMQTEASKDRAFAKYARIDRELLSRYSKGLLATTGCPSGAVQTYLRLGMYKEAVREAAELQDIFGKDNFWVEVMDHGIPFERQTRADLLKLAKDINAPLLATNDLHYVEPEDAIAQDALLCINSGDSLNNPDRFHFDGSGYYVKSTEEMFELFKELPDAMTNTMEIADRCNTSYVQEQGRFMPHVPLPENKDPELEKRVREIINLGEKAREQKAEKDGKKYVNRHADGITKDEIDEGAYFISEVMKGLNERFPEGADKEHLDQINFELDTILDMGFPSYFLVVAEFVQWAKANNIFVGPGRGSAAGSLVAYSLKITDLDPIPHKLVFERFLNPERISLPDIDIDFEEGGREQVIQHCADIYGDDMVAQIITYTMIMSKNAMKDSARILDYPYNTGDELSKLYPEAAGGKNGTITQFLDDPEYARYKEGEDFRQAVAANPDYQKVTDLAKRIEGLTRGSGVHASGVLVSTTPIADFCPTMMRWDDHAMVTQFEAHGCEELGFVKFDFLGIKNLNTNKSALENIKLQGKEVPDLLKIPLDDPKTFELIGNAETIGVFQLDGDGMRSLMKRMRPNRFDDISATIALYRPGPMGMGSHISFADRKNGREEITPIHPEVEEALRDILDDTYGLIVFQEQIQFAARKLANYTMGEADVLRRIMGKKKPEELDASFITFRQGMLDNGYSEEAIKAVWDVFVPFAGYAFNRAHTACYAFNAYTNAYLKAHFPVEYMAALLTTNTNNHTKLGTYLAECARMGIKVKVPSVNHAMVDFAPDGEDVLFGLAAIQNVGEGTAQEIIAAREEKGEFTDFMDFLDKVPGSVLNKRKVESLIKAGAFDEFGVPRQALFMIHQDAIDQIMPVKQKESMGQFDLFGSLGLSEQSAAEKDLQIEIPNVEEWDQVTKLGFEKEMLGLYVSDHPLAGFSDILTKNRDFPLVSVNDSERMKSFDRSGEAGRSRWGAGARVSGQIQSISIRMSAAGNKWGTIVLEDTSGTAEIRMFGRVFEKCLGERTEVLLKKFPDLKDVPVMKADDIWQMGVQVQVREGGEVSLIGTTENKKLTTNTSGNQVIKLNIDSRRCSKRNLGLLKELLLKYPGESPVEILFHEHGKTRSFKISDKIRIEPSVRFFGEMRVLFGAS